MTDKDVDFGVIGLGAGGGRLASAIGERASITSLAMNTAAVDLSKLTGVDRKLKIGDTDGAGKDLNTGKLAVTKSTKEIMESVVEVFPTQRILLVCATLGGGTGSGGVSQLQMILKRLRVGSHQRMCPIITVLPSLSRSPDEQVNALLTVNMLIKEKVPVFLFDNQSLVTDKGDRSIEGMYRAGNYRVASLFRDFIRLSKIATLEALDREDLFRIIRQPGIGTFGRVDLHDIDEHGFQPEKAISDSMFCDARFQTAARAGIILKIGAEADTFSSMASSMHEKIISKFSDHNILTTVGKYTEQGKLQTELVFMLTGLSIPPRLEALKNATRMKAKKVQEKRDRKESLLSREDEDIFKI